MALQKVPESDAGIFYDDKILMAVGNYVAAAETLRVVATLAVREYSRIFEKKGSNSFSSTMKKLDAKNNRSKPVKRKAKEYGLRKGMSLVPQYGRGRRNLGYGIARMPFKPKRNVVMVYAWNVRCCITKTATNVLFVTRALLIITRKRIKSTCHASDQNGLGQVRRYVQYVR